MTASVIYLDYNAFTPCDPRVVEAMNPYWMQFGNPHSAHFLGKQKQDKIAECLEILSEIYNCLEDDIIFTSGATEANNLAIFSGVALAQQKNPQADTLLLSHLEHKSVLEPLKEIARRNNLKVVFVNINKNGIINIDDFRYKITNNNVLWASVIMVNGEVGTVQPIKEISDICSENQVFLHTDASQAGYENIDFFDLGVDFLTISGHKIYAPSGIGMLISKHFNNPNFAPAVFGGGQQNNLRSGTLPLPLIIGLTKACQILHDSKDGEITFLQNLRKKLIKGLKDSLDIKIHGDINKRHPGNLHLAIENCNALQLLNRVQPNLIFSLGSACNGMNLEYSPLLKQMGISALEAEWSFRMCVGRMTGFEDIGRVLKLITGK